MLLGKIEKQPIDRQNYFVKYCDYLQQGEFIVNAIAELDVTGSLIASGPLIMPDKETIQFVLEGGIDGSTYKLDITITTNLDNVKQDEIKIRVKEV